jgi:hypothetical protein
MDCVVVPADCSAGQQSRNDKLSQYPAAATAPVRAFQRLPRSGRLHRPAGGVAGGQVTVDGGRKPSAEEKPAGLPGRPKLGNW